MARGYLALVLHAHLPYGGAPSRPGNRGRLWFNQCAAECYLPLVRILDRLNRDGVHGRITLSLSPTLMAMMRDPVVNERLLEHLARMLELSAREMNRTALQADLRELTGTYHLRFLQIRNTLETRCGGNLLRAFAELQAGGRVELIPCAASHAFLPGLVAMQPQAARCQIRLGLDAFREAFGHSPPGFWLPECAYTPELDALLGEEGVGYTIVDGRAIEHGSMAAVHGVHAPVYCPSGVAAFGRDRDGARMAWCDAAGHPTDRLFRDNTRDIGYELPLDYLRPHLPGAASRTATGFGYHCIGGSNGRPGSYERKPALDAAADRAQTFMRSVRERAESVSGRMDRPPIVTAAYDLHRFGRHWFEGPEFLDYLFRKIHYDQHVLEMITPADYLDRHRCNQVTLPSVSSWSEEGYFQDWVGERTAWVYRHLARAARVMHHLTVATGAGRNGDDNGRAPNSAQENDLCSRALRVAGRQLVLAQAGDWVAMMRDEDHAAYGRHRLGLHLRNFSRIASQIESRDIDAAQIEQLERDWPIFEQIPTDAYW